MSFFGQKKTPADCTAGETVYLFLRQGFELISCGMQQAGDTHRIFFLLQRALWKLAFCNRIHGSRANPERLDQFFGCHDTFLNILRLCTEDGDLSQCQSYVWIHGLFRPKTRLQHQRFQPSGRFCDSLPIFHTCPNQQGSYQRSIRALLHIACRANLPRVRRRRQCGSRVSEML